MRAKAAVAEGWPQGTACQGFHPGWRPPHPRLHRHVQRRERHGRRRGAAAAAHPQHPVRSLAPRAMKRACRQRRATGRALGFRPLRPTAVRPPRPASPLSARPPCRCRCKVNLIVFNPHEGTAFKPSTPERVQAFRSILIQARTSRGPALCCRAVLQHTERQHAPLPALHPPVRWPTAPLLPPSPTRLECRAAMWPQCATAVAMIRWQARAWGRLRRIQLLGPPAGDATPAQDHLS